MERDKSVTEGFLIFLWVVLIFTAPVVVAVIIIIVGAFSIVERIIPGIVKLLHREKPLDWNKAKKGSK